MGLWLGRNRDHPQFCVVEPVNNASDRAAMNADVQENSVIQGFQSRGHFPSLPVLDGTLPPSLKPVHPPRAGCVSDSAMR